MKQLDLLCNPIKTCFLYLYHLHSNMVRFIIKELLENIDTAVDLHSNMVRFIMLDGQATNRAFGKFTFQYG